MIDHLSVKRSARASVGGGESRLNCHAISAGT
jgi:hypothetical protein